MGSYTMRIQGATQRHPTTSANALAASAVVFAGPAKLYSVSGYSSALYVLLFDTTSVPADATTALVTIPVSGGQFYYDLQDGLLMTTGICVSNSSTPVTKTIGGADTQFLVAYRPT